MTKLQDFLNLPVKEVAGMIRHTKNGDLFGIELECEGLRVDWDGRDPDILLNWAPHQDGSLRNNHGGSCEWVFNGPVTYERSLERIDGLFDYFEKKKARLVCSNRTSTHVHFNMSDKTTYQLVNMYILFTIIEGLMDRYCGEDRAGNLFCLSSRYAERQIDWVMDCCFKNYRFAFNNEWRYCSFNLAAINKFGSVEFRGMRGLDNREDLKAWLSIVNEFCNYACYTMKNPVDLIQMISLETPKGFLRKVFSKTNYDRLTAGLNDAEISGSIYEGLRLVQMLCYKIGTEFDQVRLRGKDFWASFKDDKEPVLDIEPDDIKRRGVVRGGRRRAEVVDPFVVRGGDRVVIGDDGQAFRVVDGVEALAPQPQRAHQLEDDDADDVQWERDHWARVVAQEQQQRAADEGRLRGQWREEPMAAEARNLRQFAAELMINPKKKAKINHGDV